ncbi:hypothetical protein, partial [Staphylococcus aureus]
LYDQDENNITDAMIPADPSQMVLKEVNKADITDKDVISNYLKFELKKALSTNTNTYTFVSSGNSYGYSTN